MAASCAERFCKVGTLACGLPLAAIVLGAAAPAMAQTVAPLPASDYVTRPACHAPAPGQAACLAVELVPRTAEARAHTHPLGMTRSRPIASATAAEGVDGLRPEDLRSAYFAGEPPYAPVSEPQTIALVDAYNDPHAEADLELYEKEFGLPELPKCAAGAVADCFEKVNQFGETTNLPSTEGGWALEISTDIEVARAICHNCRILLVEANSAEYSDLATAEDTAVDQFGATEVSNSWGGEEPQADSPAFNHPDTVITAAAGDDGYLNWTIAAEAQAAKQTYYSGADYPASSPHVVAVGGTSLALSGGVRQGETVWNDGEAQGAAGGGCSTQFSAPEWQREVSDWAQVGCGTGAAAKRAVADVSADADPYTGVAVYDSVPYPEEKDGHIATRVLGWTPIGGTSVASPIVASVFALAGGAHGVEYPAMTLYSHLGSPSLYDVTTGGNGRCNDLYKEGCPGSMKPLSPLDCGEGALICNAASGYDGPTGVGAPNGVAAFEPTVEGRAQRVKEREAAEQQAAEEKLGAEKKAAEERERKAEEAKRAAEKQATEELTTKQAEEAKAAEAHRAEAERTADERKLEEEAEALGGSGGKGPGGEGTASGSTGANKLAGGVSGPESGELGGLSSGAGAARQGSSTTTVHISGLALTARASAAIARGLPAVGQVAFSFTLSATARVQVTLSRLVRVDGHLRWDSVPGGFTFSPTRGHHRSHLRGRGTLPAGRYRLTLIPAHGAARSLGFLLG